MPGSLSLYEAHEHATHIEIKLKQHFGADTQSAGSVIPEKEYTLSNLTVNALHAALLGLLVTIILPILLLAGGIVIFMVRRKK